MSFTSASAAVPDTAPEGSAEPVPRFDPATVTVVQPGHLCCARCGFEAQWSGGVRVGETSFRSESLAAYLHFAEHTCRPTSG